MDLEKQNKYVIYQTAFWFIAVFILLFSFLFQKKTEVVCFILLLVFTIFLIGFFVKSYADITCPLLCKVSWLGLILSGGLHIVAIFLFVIFFVDRYVKYGNEPPDLEKEYKDTHYNEEIRLVKILSIILVVSSIVTLVALVAGNSNLVAVITSPIILYTIGASAYEVYIASHFMRFVARRPITTK